MTGAADRTAPDAGPSGWPWLAALRDVHLLRVADLRQVIRTHHRILGFEVPHPESLVIGHADLERIAEQEGIAVQLVAGIDPVVLVADVPANERAGVDDWVVERRVLARVVHARADAQIDALTTEGELDDGRALELLETLDLAATREAIRVLEHVERLESDDGPAVRLREIIATALELRTTTDGHSAFWFPSLDPSHLDVVTAALGDRLALPALIGAAGAQRATTLASERAEPATTTDVPEERRVRDLTLGRQLADALPVGAPSADEWSRALAALPDEPSNRRYERAQSRVRRDLERACRAGGRIGLTFRPLRWLRGQGPLLEPLVHLPWVRTHHALKKARSHAENLESHGRALLRLVDRARHLQAAAVRERISPILAETLHQSGLTPANVPEAVASESVVGELVDRLLEADYLGFSDLRDAVSGNRLKLRDTSPASVLLGDALLRADRALARRLPGVYRKSTVYMRLIQRASAVAFGTPPGRLLTRFCLLPFLTAFVVLEGGQHMIGPLAAAMGLGHPHLATTPAVISVGLVLLLLFEYEPAQSAALRALRSLGRGLRWTFVLLPGRLVDLETLRALTDNYLLALFRRFLVRPLVALGLVWVILRAYDVTSYLSWPAWVALFVGISAALNSRLGRQIQTDVTDALGGFWGLVVRRAIPELFRFIVRSSKRLLHAVEKLVWLVEEALRLRRGQSRPTQVVRAVAGRLWSAVTYVLRAYITLLIEPQINPVKHFPVVTVSHKLMVPAIPEIYRAMAGVLVPVFGDVLGTGIAGTTVFLLPGLFGFVVWELSSNWRLFEANRPDTIRPVQIGHHGEDLPALLRPGFRSGAVPKLVEKMRDEARRAWERGVRPELRGPRHHLSEIEERVLVFFDRELAELLTRTAVVPGSPRAQTVQLGRYRMSVLVAPAGQSPLALWLEDRQGELVATLRRPGFASGLGDAERRAVADALIGVLEMADVDRLELPFEGAVEVVRLDRTVIEWTDWVDRWTRAGGTTTQHLPGAERLADALAVSR